VPNGGFESYKQCPETYSVVAGPIEVNDWTSSNQGTPDYFNACSKQCGVPVNWIGNAPAFEGKAYMGLIACMEQLDRNQIAYREYIRVKLVDSLKSGNSYYASMQVRLGLSCLLSCNGLGMFFATSPLQSGSTVNYPVEPDITFKNSEVPTDKGQWIQLCGTYQAKGGEQYLIIGNFLSNQQMKYREFDENLIQTYQVNPMAYFYIDDVQVMPFDSTMNYDCESLIPEKPMVFDNQLPDQGRLILKHVFFETDQSVILPESFNELDRLVLELKRNPAIRLRIEGHTDNSGTMEHNQELSEARALAVKKYLLAREVSPRRIGSVGFGSTRPISGNDTDEGKQLNRRVEIEIIQ